MWMAACRSGPGASWVACSASSLPAPAVASSGTSRAAAAARTCACPSDIRSRDRSHATVETAPSAKTAPRRCTDPITRLRCASIRHTSGCTTRNSASCSPSDRPSRSTSASAAIPASSSRTAAATPPVEPMCETYQPGPTIFHANNTVHSRSGRPARAWISQLWDIARLGGGGAHAFQVGAGAGDDGRRDGPFHQRRVSKHHVWAGLVCQHGTSGDHGAAEVGQDEYTRAPVGPRNGGGHPVVAGADPSVLGAAGGLHRYVGRTQLEQQLP